MYSCPNGCVKTESQMNIYLTNYECPICKMKGKWVSKRISKDGKIVLNPKGHTYVQWQNGDITVNRNS